MPKPTTAYAFNPLQAVSPAMLMFSFVLFFLPWVELQCVPPADAVKNVPKEELEKAKKELGFDPTKTVSIATQSGFQIATGGSSPGSDMKKIENKMKEEMKGAGGDVTIEKSKDKDKDDTKGAPLLFLYPVLLLGGIVVAFVPIPPMIRRIAVAGCCGAALAVVGLQAVIGFPIENDLKKKNDEMKALTGGFGGGFGGPPAGGKAAGGKDAKDTKSSAADIVRVSWQFSLYLTFLLLLGAAGAAFLDGIAAGGGAKGKYGRKGRRDDYDDDDDDDRPRKRRRDEEEDEEEERPRKKRRDEEEDEDDRPKKRRRDEDEEDNRPRKSRRDEEEDRPRKKKPLEPEFEMPAPLPPPPPAAPPAPAGPNPFAFDDDEPAPKKKPRRRDDDDDDYDDRPRKKRRRDDDD